MRFCDLCASHLCSSECDLGILRCSEAKKERGLRCVILGQFLRLKHAKSIHNTILVIISGDSFSEQQPGRE